MLNNTSDVGLDVLCVLTEFSELVAVVAKIDAVDVLNINTSDVLRFFVHNVTDVTVLGFVLVLDAYFFVGAAS